MSGRPRVRVAVWRNQTWSFLEPLFPTGEPRSASEPSLALDPTGRPLLAWEESDGRSQRLRVQSWDGEAWRALGGAVSIRAEQNTFEPALARRASELALAWREYDNVTQGNNIYVARWDGDTWRPLGDALDVDLVQGSYSPALALDARGAPVVAWREHGAGTGTNIRVKRWDGNAWHELGGIVSLDPARAAEVPSLAVDAADRPVLAWQEHDGASTDIHVARWDGDAWTLLGDALDVVPEHAARQPALAIAADGQPVVAWSERGEVATIFVKRWDGRNWRPLEGEDGGPDPAAGGGAYAPSLTTDTTGAVTVAWHEYDGTTFRIRVRRWDGERWRALPTPVATSPETSGRERASVECADPEARSPDPAR